MADRRSAISVAKPLPSISLGVTGRLPRLRRKYEKNEVVATRVRNEALRHFARPFGRRCFCGLPMILLTRATNASPH